MFAHIRSSVFTQFYDRSPTQTLITENTPQVILRSAFAVEEECNTFQLQAEFALAYLTMSLFLATYAFALVLHT